MRIVIAGDKEAICSLASRGMKVPNSGGHIWEAPSKNRKPPRLYMLIDLPGKGIPIEDVLCSTPTLVR